MAPGDPRGWLQLGYLGTFLLGPTRESAGALLMSMRTGAYDAPDFVQMRLHLALLHWELLESGEREDVYGQVNALWNDAPFAVVELGLHEDFLPLLLRALQGRPDAQYALVDGVEQS